MKTPRLFKLDRTALVRALGRASAVLSLALAAFGGAEMSAPIPAIAAAPVAWVWANEAARSGTYVPATTYQRNARGGRNTITRQGTGSYVIDFPGHGAFQSHVQVATYETVARCYVNGWGPSGNTLRVWVQCYGTDGFYADARFSAYVTSIGTECIPVPLVGEICGGRVGTRGGFVLSNQPSAPGTYTPPAVSQWNSAGGINTIVRDRTGSYTVRMPRLGALEGAIQATAFSYAPRFCKIAHVADGRSDQQIKVNCFDHRGELADSRFTLLFDADAAGFALVDQSSRDFVTPDLDHQGNSTGAANTVRRTGRGVYDVTFPGLAASGGNALVTAFGGGAHGCTVSVWVPSGPNELVRIRCHNRQGQPVDSGFSVRFSR